MGSQGRPMQVDQGVMRLNEIALQVNDGWVRCRGPLTGLKALQAARVEAETLGASPRYMELMDEIVKAAKALSSPHATGAYRDAPAVIERAAPKLVLEAQGDHAA
jgi:hypothetical protein